MPRTSDWHSFPRAQSGPRYAAPGWALITLFIIYGSLGAISGDGRSPWGPLYVSFPDVLQNILLYLPFGCFGALALDNRRRSLAWRATEVALLACGLSLIAESGQLFITDRTASLIDVAAGTLGAGLGALAAPAGARVADAAFERARRLGITGSSSVVPLTATVTALVAVAWWPYDITLDPGTVAARIDVFRADPWQSDDWIALGSHALRYAATTLLIALSLERLGARDAALVAMSSGLLLAIVLDAGQMIMGGRPAGLAHLAWQIVGCSVGGAVFALSRKAERQPPA